MLLVAAGSLAEQQTEEREKQRKIITDWYFMCTPPHVCVRAHTDPHIEFRAGYGVEKHILKTEGRKEGDFTLIFRHKIEDFFYKCFFYLKDPYVDQSLTTQETLCKSDTTKITTSFFSSRVFLFQHISFQNVSGLDCLKQISVSIFRK